ncbi:hypothetical protein [Alicyclobacillus acidiphilus]|uniref:hypothetical protein n=1 Tax=Alicyclobacillus acidiphilus TaxID=182455 RepID=UPI00082A1134|nr:hypothetical protein [Alicyclobacillus acidiphilus]
MKRRSGWIAIGLTGILAVSAIAADRTAHDSQSVAAQAAADTIRANGLNVGLNDHTAVAAFPGSPIVGRIVQTLQTKTSLPLFGPTWLPMKPAMDPKPYADVSALLYATKNHDEVTLIYTDKPVAINSPELTSQYGGLARQLGDFGADAYPTHAAAVKAESRYWVFRQPSGAAEHISLGGGIVGVVSNIQREHVAGNDQTYGDITWKEGAWTFQVSGSELQDNLNVAKSMVAYIAKHPMPEKAGYVSVDNGGDGEHTEADWVLGNDVLHCGNYHDAIENLQMVESTELLTQDTWKKL